MIFLNPPRSGLILIFALFFSFLPAQDQSLPSNSTGELNPIVPPAQGPTVTFGEPQSSNASSQSQAAVETLTKRPPLSPGRVSPDEYFRMLQTTGSYRVNRERAQAEQSAAVSRAREMNKLKEEMSMVRHYRLHYNSPEDFLKSNPPAPDPEPEDVSPPTAPSNTSGQAEHNRSVVANAAASDVPEFVPVNGPRSPLLRRLRLNRKQRNPVDDSSPTPSPTAEAPPVVGNPYAENGAAPVPPTGGSPPPAPPNIPVPNFAGREGEGAPEPNRFTPAPSPAAPSLPGKKGLFSRFRKSPGPASVPAPPPPSPSAPADAAPLAEASQLPVVPAPAGPAANAIFRPGSGAARGNTLAVITGGSVQADLGNGRVRLSPGTQVHLLRSGTTHSLVRLNDNREALVPNSALATE